MADYVFITVTGAVPEREPAVARAIEDALRAPFELVDDFGEATAQVVEGAGGPVVEVRCSSREPIRSRRTRWPRDLEEAVAEAVAAANGAPCGVRVELEDESLHEGRGLPPRVAPRV